MPAKIDLTGQRFGRLLVLSQGSPVISAGQKKVTWICQCECGNIATVASERLRYGMTKSCGCLAREVSSKKRDDTIIGATFGRLTVTAFAGKDKAGHTMLECKCSCGNRTVVSRSNLSSGATTSCGCARKESASKQKTTHGGTNTRLYRVWCGMNERCNDPSHISYKLYGARGVSVCREWASDYAAFRDWAEASGYDKDAKRGDCTLDRIDVNGNYCPENCRWVSMAIQSNNRRNHKQ